MPDEFIWIVTDQPDDEPVVEGQRGWANEVQRKLARFKDIRLSAADLERKMGDFLQLVGRIFQQAEGQVGTGTGLQLDEVELTVEISGEGEVKLIAGGKAAGKGAITLKFKRTATRPDSQ